MQADSNLLYGSPDWRETLKSFDHIEDNNIKLAMKPYPSVKLLADFAELVYSDCSDFLAFHPLGWYLLTTARNSTVFNGYFGCAVWSPSQHQIVIAHRGTDKKNLGALYADVQSVYRNNYTGHMNSAVSFADEVKREIIKVNREHGSCFVLSFTGHSLGAWLAGVTTFTVKYLKMEGDGFRGIDSPEEGLHAHTLALDSPGIEDILIKICRKYGTKYDQSKCSKYLDITNFFAAPNAVNCTGYQVGNLLQIHIERVAKSSELNLWNRLIRKIWTPNTDTHGVHNFITAFKERRDTYEVENWPQGWSERKYYHREEMFCNSYLLIPDAIQPPPESSSGSHQNIQPVTGNAGSEPILQYSIIKSMGTICQLGVFSTEEFNFIQNWNFFQRNVLVKRTEIENFILCQKLNLKIDFPTFKIDSRRNTITCDSKEKLEKVIGQTKQLLRWFPADIKDAMDLQIRSMESAPLYMAGLIYLDTLPLILDCEDTLGLESFLESPKSVLQILVTGDFEFQAARLYNILFRMENINLDIKYLDEKCHTILNWNCMPTLDKAIDFQGLSKTDINISNLIILIANSAEITTSQLTPFLENLKKFRHKKLVVIKSQEIDEKLFENYDLTVETETSKTFKLEDLTPFSRKTIFSRDAITIGEKTLSLEVILGNDCKTSNEKINTLISPILKNLVMDNFHIEIPNNLPRLCELDVLHSKGNKVVNKEGLTALLERSEADGSMLVIGNPEQLNEGYWRELKEKARRRIFTTEKVGKDLFKKKCQEKSARLIYWFIFSTEGFILKEIYNSSVYLHRKFHNRYIIQSINDFVENDGSEELFIVNKSEENKHVNKAWLVALLKRSGASGPLLVISSPKNLSQDYWEEVEVAERERIFITEELEPNLFVVKCQEESTRQIYWFHLSSEGYILKKVYLPTKFHTRFINEFITDFTENDEESRDLYIFKRTEGFNRNENSGPKEILIFKNSKGYVQLDRVGLVALLGKSGRNPDEMKGTEKSGPDGPLLVIGYSEQLNQDYWGKVKKEDLKRIFTTEEDGRGEFLKKCQAEPSRLIYLFHFSAEGFTLNEIYTGTDKLSRQLHSQFIVESIDKIIRFKDLFIFKNVGERISLINPLDVSGETDFKLPTQECIKEETLSKHYFEFLKIRGPPCLVWKYSKGSMDGLRPFIKRDSKEPIEEEDFSSRKKKVTIIADEPGKGKTTILTRMSELIQDTWVLRIDTNFTSTELPQKLDLQSITNYLIRVYVLPTNIEFVTSLLQYCLQSENSRKVCILVDAFDEITNEKSIEIVNLLKCLNNDTTCQIVVSTRVHQQERLENDLRELATEFEKITEEEQQLYLVNFWLPHLALELPRYGDLEKGKLRHFAEKLQKKVGDVLGEDVASFMGIPLQIRMLAEVYLKEAILSVLYPKQVNTLCKITNLFELYKQFIEVKKTIYFEQKTILNQIPKDLLDSMVKGTMKKHCQLAFQTIDSTFATQYFTDKKSSNLKEKLRDISSLGLLKYKITDETFNFIHRTFQEYFCADFFVRWLREGNNNKDKNTLIKDEFCKFLVEPSYKIIRMFIESQLEISPIPCDALENHPIMYQYWSEHRQLLLDDHKKTSLHIAAEEQNEHIFTLLLSGPSSRISEEAYFSLISARDMAGRTVLNIALKNGNTNIVKEITKSCLYDTLADKMPATFFDMGGDNDQEKIHKKKRYYNILLENYNTPNDNQSQIYVNRLIKPILKKLATDFQFWQYAVKKTSSNIPRLCESKALYSKGNRLVVKARLTALLERSGADGPLLVISDPERLSQDYWGEGAEPARGRIFMTEDDGEDLFKDKCREESSARIIYWLNLRADGLYLKVIYNSGLYMPRKFHTRFIIESMDKFVGYSENKDVFIFNNANDKISFISSFNLSKEGEENFVSKEHFKMSEDILKEGTFNKHYFKKLEIRGRPCLVWQYSHGSLDSLRPFITRDDRDPIDEVTFSNTRKNLTIIADDPGMGKTTSLTRMSELIRDSWVLKIDYNHLTAIDKLPSKLNLQSVSKFLTCDSDLTTDDDLLSSLLQYCLESNSSRQVCILVDAIDEITEENTKIKMLEVLKYLKNTTYCKTIVTTRVHLQEWLENELSEFSAELQKITKKEQDDFMVNFWLPHLALELPEHGESVKGRLRQFARELWKEMEGVLGGDVASFMGVPLQIRTLAEVFLQQAIQSVVYSEQTQNLCKITNLYDLYTQFIKVKKSIYLEQKSNFNKYLPLTIQNQMFSNIMENHCILAFQSLDPKFAAEYFHNTIFSNQHLQDMSALGLIKVRIDETVHFIHRTFIEYFCADFFVKWLKQGRQINKNNKLVKSEFCILLLRPDYYLIRKFIESQLASPPIPSDALESNPILYKYWSEYHQLFFNDGVKTPLHIAVQEKNLHTSAVLLSGPSSKMFEEDYICFIAAREKAGRTALNIALANGNLNIVRLIEANVESCLYESKLKLMLASFLDYESDGDHNLFSKISSNEQPSSSLHRALIRTEQIRKQIPPFMMAVREDDYSTVNKILSGMESDTERAHLVIAIDSEGDTAINLAASKEDHTLFKLFAKQGVCVSYDKHGQTPLHCAAEQGYSNIVKFLLNQSEETYEHINNKFFVQEKFGNRNVTLKYENNCSINSQEMLAHINSVNNNGYTALMQAVWNGHHKVICMLLSADINLAIRDGNAAMIFGAQEGDYMLINMLLEYGANINSADICGNTALMHAARNNYDKVIRILLGKGAEINHQNVRGETAISEAAFYGHVNIVELLLQYNADISLQDQNGRTALYRAEEREHQEIVDLLRGHMEALPAGHL